MNERHERIARLAAELQTPVARHLALLYGGSVMAFGAMGVQIVDTWNDRFDLWPWHWLVMVSGFVVLYQWMRTVQREGLRRLEAQREWFDLARKELTGMERR